MSPSAAPPNPRAPSGGWKDRLATWMDTEWLRQHEGQVMLVVTLIIGAVVGLVIAAFIYVTENLGSRMYPPGSSQPGGGW